ncbi:MAG TPA: hydrogenase expression/formation protein HypE [Bacteroidales bacterium]|nr:hydrogenase expression/formation protein HypE [Bacteroidales bacterium]
MSEVVTLGHGSGGKLAHELIDRVFVSNFGMTGPLTDSAILEYSGVTLAFTTDSYVIDPLFFPGGDIGKLAVCGTVNDLAVSGADVKYMATSFIIEEGFPLSDLRRIAASMTEEAKKAGIRIVTGDTKVVEKGKCDKLFINTSGTGFLRPDLRHISTGSKIRPGDKLIINGPLGNHSAAILAARNIFNFSIPVESDCASLNHLINSVLKKSSEVHFMRDLTRGGLSSVLNELSDMISYDIIVNEASVPVEEPVKGLCEILGFDPLSLANEGKVLFVVGENDHEMIMDVLRSDPLGRNSAVIGGIINSEIKRVILNTSVGGRRILDMPSGIQLPRIC